MSLGEGLRKGKPLNLIYCSRDKFHITVGYRECCRSTCVIFLRFDHWVFQILYFLYDVHQKKTIYNMYADRCLFYFRSVVVTRMLNKSIFFPANCLDNKSLSLVNASSYHCTVFLMYGKSSFYF